MSSEGFFDFCGSSPIFNTSLLLDSSWPQFTDCFQNSLLVWVPCGWLWVTLPAYLIYLRSFSARAPLPFNLLNCLKAICSLILVVLSALDFVAAKDDGPSVPGIVYVARGLRLVSFLLAAVLTQVERRKALVTSGVLWIFWLLQAVAGIVPFYSQIILKVYDIDRFSFALVYVSYAVVIVQLIVHSFAENLTRHGYHLIGKKPSPEVTASFPSRLIFWWINRIILTAYRKGLQEEDLFDLHPRDQSSTVWPVFQRAWQKELCLVNSINSKRRLKEALQHRSVSYKHSTDLNSHHWTQNGATETTALLNGFPSSSAGSMTDTVSIKSKKVEVSLLRVLAKTYGWEMLSAWACKIIYDFLQFVSPQLLDLLIAYTNNQQKEPEWKGYVFACSFFVVAIAGSIFFQQQFHIGMTLGMRIKSACISAVYQKALTMTNEARKGSTVGEIVNLMAVDCQRLQDMAGYLWMVWSAPLQIALALTLLWGQLGASVLAGVALMLLLIPLNARIAFQTKRYQVQQMRLKDERLKLMNEILAGMKVLKLYAWEPSFEAKVQEIRGKELQVLRKTAILNAVATFTWTCAPFVVTLATFATFILSSSSSHLDAQKAFVSLSLFNILRSPINLLPMIISSIAQAQVSITRVETFLKNEELDPSNVLRDSNSPVAVSIRSGTFTWDKALSVPTLRNIDVEIPRGRLVAVVGQVGAGKSSLISAMLGEMAKVDGAVRVQNRIAYVPQQAWIQNATLRDNILFGKEYNSRRYDKVIEACALRPDLDILPGRDMTEIGEKGINLSGGQKQRVSLARAVYSDADIYLLDDPLSAVDSHVGRHIVQKVVGPMGLLKHKTRVLVTHGVHWLPLVDEILVMTDGRISERGSYEELLSHDGDFAQFLKNYLVWHDQAEEDEDPEIRQITGQIRERVDSVLSDPRVSSCDESWHDSFEQWRARKRSSSLVSGSGSLRSADGSLRGDAPVALKAAAQMDKTAETKEKLVEAERSETGKVKWSVFLTYFRAVGVGSSVAILTLFGLYQSLSVGASIALSYWTDDDLLANQTLANTTEYQRRNDLYLSVYGVLGVGQAVMVLAYSFVASTSMVTAAGSLHAAMLSNIMRCPMSFFDTTPSGRIVNRFSSDVNVVDNNLPQTVRSVLLQAFSVLSTVVVISYSTPTFLLLVLPIGLLYYLVQWFYIPTSRQLKRLESTTRSPIFNHFSETITGSASIRAYGVQERFVEENKARVDKNLVFYFAGIASNRWLGFRLEFLGNLVVLAAAMFAVLTPDLEGGLVGLSVSYAMQVTASLTWLVRMMSDLETNVVSVERLKEYAETPTEADWIVKKNRPPVDWPSEGSVHFVNYATRYRDGLDLVLKGINCHIQGGDKVGIVGRTGAGKSSMTLALFRLIESATGSIVIDRHTLADMGLHDLRSRITILPQDPVLFSGSLRMNLDPFNQYSDHQIWTALEHAHLKKFVTETPAQLTYECGEGGSNLSVGQRQLVCLARSLLRKTKILVLDEATAAVDMETDALIQRTIRSEFKDCTVITIAHRLNTILDYDRILVMEQGQVKEFDRPSALLDDKKSAFYSMARDAKLVS